MEDVAALGAIRSARKYYVDLVQSYDAIYVHGGGSDEAYAYMKELGMKNIDGVMGAYGYLYFYRDQTRLDQGYDKVHTLFTNGANAIAYAQKLKEPLTRPGGVSYGLLFDQENAFTGTSANRSTNAGNGFD
jgi:hypothetical protein